jgi:predicted ATPase
MDIFLSTLFFVAPVRPSGQLVYNIGQALATLGASYESDFVALMAENTESQEAVNDWLLRMAIDYKIEVKMVNDQLAGHYMVNIYDLSGEKEIQMSLKDVGYGLPQILPVIAGCVARRASTLLIEQPELHIHPRLQAELGDLFAEAVKQYKHQLIVETHSEHLMLRIQKLIRKNELKPEDVSVLYVSRGQNGSAVQRLRLNKRGMFIDPWPEGFFPERLDEILG